EVLEMVRRSGTVESSAMVETLASRTLAFQNLPARYRKRKLLPAQAVHDRKRIRQFPQPTDRQSGTGSQSEAGYPVEVWNTAVCVHIAAAAEIQVVPFP